MQEVGEPELGGPHADQSFAGRIQQLPAGAVGEDEHVVVVEREERDVNLLHRAAQERARLNGAEPLLAQRVAQCIHFPECEPECVVGARATPAHREVSLAQRGQQVGHGGHGVY